MAPELLDPERSRVAVVANLYGDGMYAMFCNLLFNPQVRHLVAVGEDLGLPTCDEIAAFLRDGLADAMMLGKRHRRVVGTQRLFPALDEFDDERLRRRLTFRYLGRLSRPDFGPALTQHLDALPQVSELDGPRVRVDIPAAQDEDVAYLPSHVLAHQVVRRTPLDCWEELVVRCIRFGRPVMLEKGLRLELLNAHVVIEAPADDPVEALAEYAFSLDDFRDYQRRILNPELPSGISYTYGNRLRGRFPQADGGTDTLQTVIETLRGDPESRQAYISLWDTSLDLPGEHGSSPCLTTLFFRRSEGRLTLTATYRSHNLLIAWLKNVYGLMSTQRHVADAVGVPRGPITVVSHSLGIDPTNARYDMARAMAERWTRDGDIDRTTGKVTLREDPNGYFVVSVDRERRTIVAEHRYAGVLVKRYEAERAVTIENEVAADMAVSLVSHAMWLGRELTSKERLLHADR